MLTSAAVALGVLCPPQLFRWMLPQILVWMSPKLALDVATAFAPLDALWGVLGAGGALNDCGA